MRQAPLKLFLSLLLIYGCALQPHLDTDRKIASRNGNLVPENEYLSVVTVYGLHRGAGSGVLIANDIVLTAFHVTGDLGVDIGFGSHVYENGIPKTRHIGVSSQYVVSSDPRKELVLLKLNEKIEGVDLPQLIEHRLPHDTPLTSVGYGISPHDKLHNWKRSADLLLSRYAYVKKNLSLMASDHKVEDTFEMAETKSSHSNAMPCVGDSGGPVFYEQTGKTPLIVGILSTTHMTEQVEQGIRPVIRSHTKRCKSVDMARFVPVHLYLSDIKKGIDELSPRPFHFDDLSLKKGLGASLSSEQEKIIREILESSSEIKAGKLPLCMKTFSDRLH